VSTLSVCLKTLGITPMKPATFAGQKRRLEKLWLTTFYLSFVFFPGVALLELKSSHSATSAILSYFRMGVFLLCTSTFIVNLWTRLKKQHELVWFERPVNEYKRRIPKRMRAVIGRLRLQFEDKDIIVVYSRVDPYLAVRTPDGLVAVAHWYGPFVLFDGSVV
jgi:hypothetical protein